MGEGKGGGTLVSRAWSFLWGLQASARIWVEQLEAHVGQELRAPSWSDNITNWNMASSESIPRLSAPKKLPLLQPN